MSQDTFSAGVEPGGLYSPQQIKILVCYLLMGVGEPLPRQVVLDIISGGGMANFFETGAAIDELIRLHNLNEEEEGRISLTETGRQAASTLSGMIPYTLRERSVRAALQLLTRIRRERENTVVMEKMGDGVRVTCHVGNSSDSLLSLSLKVADDLQAHLIREHFLNDPVLLYRSVLAILTDGAEIRRNDTEIVIRP